MMGSKGVWAATIHGGAAPSAAKSCRLSWSRWPDSNRRHDAYEAPALPTELHRHVALALYPIDDLDPEHLAAY